MTAAPSITDPTAPRPRGGPGRAGFRRAGLAIAGAVALSVGVVAGPAAADTNAFYAQCSESGQTATCRYQNLGGTFTPPAGVTSVTVTAWGASGNANGCGGPGGRGARVTGPLTGLSSQPLAVVPGQGPIQVFRGIAGGGPGYGSGGNAGGADAGGAGAGGGGGGSAVVTTDASGRPLIVAGGGGGGGGGSVDQSGHCVAGPAGGAGGAATAGGQPATDGGDGAPAPSGSRGNGGGGGGGFHGGTGGTGATPSGSGGAGGSNLVPAGGTADNAAGPNGSGGEVDISFTLPPGTPVVHVSGSGTLPFGSEQAFFILQFTEYGTTDEGGCLLTGQTTGNQVQCSSIYDVHRTGNTVTFHGTGTYNGRQPISFSAQVTDGNPDSFVIYGANMRFGGTLSSGDIAVS